MTDEPPDDDVAAADSASRAGAPLLTRAKRLLHSIREGDDAMVSQAVIALSQRRRFLAPLGLMIGAFAMLVNFSTVVLYLAALHQISHSSIEVTQKAVVVVIVMLTISVNLPPFMADISA